MTTDFEEKAEKLNDTTKATILSELSEPANKAPIHNTKKNEAEDGERLQEVLDEVLTEQIILSEAETGGAIVSVAIVVDGEMVVVSNQPEQPIINSASMAKTFWVAAALDQTDVETVAPYATAIFTHSDNVATGRVIDLVGADNENNIDAINAWTSSHGLEQTNLNRWRAGTEEGGSASDFSDDKFNQTTAADAALFLDQLSSGELLDAEKTQQLREWMLLSPDNSADGYHWGAPIPELLPAEYAEMTAHKAGWIPDSGVLNDFGYVPLPDGREMSIAFTTVGGESYQGQADWISETTCQVWAELDDNGYQCGPDSNVAAPIPTPEINLDGLPTAKETTTTTTPAKPKPHPLLEQKISPTTTTPKSKLVAPKPAAPVAPNIQVQPSQPAPYTPLTQLDPIIQAPVFESAPIINPVVEEPQVFFFNPNIPIEPVETIEIFNYGFPTDFEQIVNPGFDGFNFNIPEQNEVFQPGPVIPHPHLDPRLLNPDPVTPHPHLDPNLLRPTVTTPVEQTFFW